MWDVPVVLESLIVHLLLEGLVLGISVVVRLARLSAFGLVRGLL
jgi:hypothetical protein